jgi:hypothetical protein
MNRPNERMLAQLKKAVLAQCALHEALDDLAHLLARASLNEEMAEALEEEVASLALRMDDHFQVVEPDMLDLESLIQLLGRFAP